MFRAHRNATRPPLRCRLLPQCEPLEGRVVPSTFRVTSLLNSGRGTLRAAIQHADAGGGASTIKFAPSVTGSIVLKKALPALTDRITIAGPGASVLTVARSSAPGTPDFRIFTVGKRAVVKITGLTIAGGVAADGGGIENAGSLSIATSTLRSNSAVGPHGSQPDGLGGGIENSGKLSVNSCTFIGNSATGAIGETGGDGEGGGIANSGTLSVADSTFSGNSAAGGGGHYAGGASGGGIENSGTLSITGSTFSGNSAAGGSSITGGDGEGGGIMNSGVLSITGSTLTGNTAAGGSGFQLGTGAGGGIANSGTLTVTDSTFSDNLSTMTEHFAGNGDGGGIANSGKLTVTGSTFSGNSAPDIGAFQVQPPLTVLGVRWSGPRRQPTGLVLTFNWPLDPSRAGFVANYGLAQTGSMKPRINPIRSAHYRPASETVTLTPKLRIVPSAPYMLTVVGDPPGGLTTTAGAYLSGAAGPGTDYIVSIPPASFGGTAR